MHFLLILYFFYLVMDVDIWRGFMRKIYEETKRLKCYRNIFGAG